MVEGTGLDRRLINYFEPGYRVPSAMCIKLLGVYKKIFASQKCSDRNAKGNVTHCFNNWSLDRCYHSKVYNLSRRILLHQNGNCITNYVFSRKSYSQQHWRWVKKFLSILKWILKNHCNCPWSRKQHTSLFLMNMIGKVWTVKLITCSYV